MSNGHARLSPSGSYRWMTCPGSVAMEDGEPDSTNEYSDEGTAGHWLAAECLKNGGHPTAFLGRVIKVVDGAVSDTVKEDAVVREFEVDVDFAGAVNVYVQRIREYATTSPDVAELHVEVPLPIDHITGEEGATGTGDVVIVLPDELQAHDLKFGMGVKVHAARNPQAMHYLSGARRKFPGAYSRFRIVIHQPRLAHLDEWDCTAAELDAFEAEASTRAGVAMMAYQTRADWMGTGASHALVPSEAACQFCKAKAKCPALAQKVQDTVGADFEVLSLTQPTDGSYKALMPTDLRTLGTKLQCVDLIEDWCKAIRAKVEGALFEHGNSAEAVATLGHKLVQGRRGNRYWPDEGAAEALLKGMRLKQDEMFTFKLITPTKAEALLKDQPKRWAKIEPLIRQNDGKPSVAPADDNRPALVLKAVVDDFSVTHDGSDLV